LVQDVVEYHPMVRRPAADGEHGVVIRAAGHVDGSGSRRWTPRAMPSITGSTENAQPSGKPGTFRFSRRYLWAGSRSACWAR